MIHYISQSWQGKLPDLDILIEEFWIKIYCMIDSGKIEFTSKSKVKNLVCMLFRNFLVDEYRLHIRKCNSVKGFDTIDYDTGFDKDLMFKVVWEYAKENFNDRDMVYLRMRYEEGLSFEEVSEITKDNPSTIRVRVMRCLHKLKTVDFFELTPDLF